MVFIIAFFFFSSFAHTIQYDLLELDEENMLFNGLDFSYDFLKGRIKKAQVNLPKKTAHIQSAHFSFQDETEREWQVYVEEMIAENIKKIKNVTLTSKTGATVHAKNIELNKAECIIENAYITPCNSQTCWKASSSKITSTKDKSILQNNELSIGNFAVPWLDLYIEHTPSSGFMMLDVKKDEFDGLVLSFPYYIYIGKHDDIIITPKISNGLAMSLKYRHKFENSILHMHSHFKYFASKHLRHGGYINLKQQDLINNNQLDYNILLATSKEYTKYWDNKENNLRRAYVPSYIYFAPSNHLTLGLLHLRNVDTNDSFRLDPKITLQKRFRYDSTTLRAETKLGGISYSEDEKSTGKQDSPFSTMLISTSFISSKLANLIALEPELGVKLHFQNDSKIARFFANNSIKFRTLPFGSFCVIPYCNMKFVYDAANTNIAFTEYNYRIQNSLYETLDDHSSLSAFTSGFLVPINEFALNFGVLSDARSNYAIISAQHARKNYFISLKDHINDKHNLSAGTGIKSTFIDFNIDYFTYEAKHKISSALVLKFNDAWSIELNMLNRIQPVQELIRGGAKLTFKNKAWIFSLGISHGSNALDYIDSKEQTIVSFSISINGIDQFFDAAKKLRTLKHQEFDLEPLARPLTSPELRRFTAGNIK